MKQRKTTRLIHSGRHETSGTGTVNPPVMRASTVLFKDVASWHDVRARRSTERLLSYGARGTETAFALEDAITELEGGYRTQLFPTGLAAVGMVFLSYLKPGDHLLITESVYEPVRDLCADFLRPHGIDYTFYAADAHDLQSKLQPNTRMIYAECPGSLVYEMIDLPALAALAKAHGALVAVDNTWASGLLYNALALGADISVLAVTKYIVGHSDVMMGAVVTTEAAWPALAGTAVTFGQAASPDDAYLALRGLRTMAARLEMHQRSALEVARWLQQRPEVTRVFYPALPEDPGYELWKRDFTGANGLMSIELAGFTEQQAESFIDALQLFGIGASWGGYESLAIPVYPAKVRNVTDWSDCGPVVRLHIGLEHPEDLIADLEQAFRARDFRP
jgi:cystathionine beta-lyase